MKWKKEYNETSNARHRQRFGVSRQRLYQLRKIAEGKCTICGKQEGECSQYCDECKEIRRELERERYARAVKP